MDYREPEDSEELRELKLAMSDGIDDVWLTLPTETIQEYTEYILRGELEEISRRIKKLDPLVLEEVNKIIDQRILKSVGLAET